jgi:2-isopropylmalate synthase
MLQDPSTKYRPFPQIDLPDRTWPSRSITKPPLWMSTDLRDGNQSLFEPMNLDRKMRMFKMLCEIGFKEIEVGFPSASQTDFDFVRHLIDHNHIPDDVTIIVLTQAREHLIRRTMESLVGSRRAIVHVYNATSPTFRDVVFNMSKQQVLDMAVDAVTLVKSIGQTMATTIIDLEYTPENFSATELEFSRDVCNAVINAWGVTKDRKVIVNLPATVEVASPNVYADQVEWMCRNISNRELVIISLHPHNDRGTGIAAAELGMMAGADRIEGCLFGNGERTGNLDLVTVALNMYTQGVSPGLDFSDINAVARTVEYCTQLPIHPRHPYVGDLVFTAFSGSHQDAIKKGFEQQKPDALWNIPYMPIDPADVGRSYDSIIRVNSQSGKGGVAYLMENEYGVVMPRRMQVEFSSVVQKHTDAFGGEVSAKDIWDLFSNSYLEIPSPVSYIHHSWVDVDGASQGISMTLSINGETININGAGNGPIDAAVKALNSLGFDIQVRSFEERSITGQEGADAQAYAIVEVYSAKNKKESFGAGIHSNTATASIQALISGVNRLAA